MSGGIDSSATALAILNQGRETSGLLVDYGQPAARSEWRAARDVAHHIGIGIERIDLGFSLAVESGEFFGRNALLILAAAGMVQARPLTVALGIHALSEYYAPSRSSCGRCRGYWTATPAVPYPSAPRSWIVPRPR